MKKILVPVDFSEKSNQALEVAVQTAKKNNAVLYVLHCVELPVRYTTRSTSELPEALFFIKLAENNIHELVQRIANQGVNIVPVLETNNISDSVQEIVEKENIDLIIMGSTGATGAKEIFIGSNAEKVIRTAQIPVLVIKDELNVDSIQNIVFACDFSQKYDNALKKALDFANLFEAKINLVYVNTPYQFRSSRETQKMIDKFKTKHKNLNNHEIFIYNDFRIEDGLSNFSQDHNSDMICVFPQKKNFLTSMFNGSVSEDLVNHSDKPILSIKL